MVMGLRSVVVGVSVAVALKVRELPRDVWVGLVTSTLGGVSSMPNILADAATAVTGGVDASFA